MHCKSYSHFFSKKFQRICVSPDVNLNESLTNDVVSFEQLGPALYLEPQINNMESHWTVLSTEISQYISSRDRKKKSFFRIPCLTGSLLNYFCYTNGFPHSNVFCCFFFTFEHAAIHFIIIAFSLFLLAHLSCSDKANFCDHILFVVRCVTLCQSVHPCMRASINSFFK